ncbi:molybdopterin-dependent oxidoreductase [Nevskia ramosa]|uniref:molybdopterin-dependent oxidoreductase n=1 Tax=Nevskia ramosa TaxID=64002 RepID=UPI0023554628|nr:molybdopterin-dependent oxidoreductase [Nevskia ramosa]
MSQQQTASTVVERKTFCGICEAACGVVVSIAGAEVLKIRGDVDHPNSKGFLCPKGAAFGAVRDDPDRVLEPLQRQPDGSFSAVSWEVALDDIGLRLRGVIKRYGMESVGVHLGNPNGWNYGAFMWLLGMAAALKTKHLYTASSVDINNYWVVGELLYGHNLVTPFPDIAHTQFLLVLGANPVVTHGSMMTAGRVKEQMAAIVERGGRVVVIDPRRSETAVQFEWQPMRPDGDPWLLAGMLKTILDEGLADQAALHHQTRGAESLPILLKDVTPARVATETGIAWTEVQKLARDFAASPAASLYGRCGASLGPFSTLTKYLIDVINIATGNLDRRGGMVYGQPMLDTEGFTRLFKVNGYDRWRTRVDGIPEVMGTSPLATLPREIRTPGRGQLRALLIASGNIATTSCASGDVGAALDELDLLISLDPYITETNQRAHYILPPTLWLEREGMPIFSQMHAGVPYAQWAPATVAPRGNARDDWWIIDEICKRIGIVPSASKAAQFLGRFGIRLSPATAVDLFMRIGPAGDWFGLRRGISRKKLFAQTSGVQLNTEPAVGVGRKRVHHPQGLIPLAQPLMQTEMARLVARPAAHDPAFPLQLISMRELRSQNSWLHNVPKLTTGDRRPHLRIHPTDARPLGLVDGQDAVITSHWGEIQAPVAISEEMMPGTVALPQGWGHGGGWRRAVAIGGGRYNDLTSNDATEIDIPSGNAVLNGLRVRVSQACVEMAQAS